MVLLQRQYFKLFYKFGWWYNNLDHQHKDWSSMVIKQEVEKEEVYKIFYTKLKLYEWICMKLALIE